MRKLIVAAALLTGCAAHQAKVFNNELRPFIGKPLSAITKYIGYPDGKLEVLGTMVYTWGTDVTVCKLQITTDPDGMIRTYHWDGYVRECAKLVDALDF
jgi:hypothetical protein